MEETRSQVLWTRLEAEEAALLAGLSFQNGSPAGVCRERLKWIVNPAGLVVSFLTLVWVVELDIGIIELIRYQIINHYVFYPVTICGIWFCLCLGKLIGKSRRLTGLFGRAYEF